MENSNKSNMLIGQTLEQIFSKHDKPKKQSSKYANPLVSQRDLEVAFTVLLVDLASCDQNFDQNEYQIITTGLMRVFGTTKDQVQSLVNQASMVISNMRGTNRFAEQLKENLDVETRQKILEVIDEIIHSDGVEDGFETYLRAKFLDLLGLSEVQPAEKIA